MVTDLSLKLAPAHRCRVQLRWFLHYCCLTSLCLGVLLILIQSSCSDTTFAQAIPYCLAGNGTLVCTDRYGGGFFLRSLYGFSGAECGCECLWQQLLCAYWVPFAVPGHFRKCNVNYQIPSRKLQITLWQLF